MRERHPYFKPTIGRKKTNGVGEPTADAKEATAQRYGLRAVYAFDRWSRDLWLSLRALDVCRVSMQFSIAVKHIIFQSPLPWATL
jgi:hypothetical protein